MKPKRHPLYGTWCNMKARCYRTTEIGYAQYGGRGIKVCDRWRNSFKAFLDDMGPKPSARHQLDRKDSNGDYTPENCRWVTTTEQSRNRRGVRFLEWNGVRLALTEWADRIGVGRSTLRDRIDTGWPIEIALTTAPNHGRKLRAILATHHP